MKWLMSFFKKEENEALKGLYELRDELDRLQRIRESEPRALYLLKQKTTLEYISRRLRYDPSTDKNILDFDVEKKLELLNLEISEFLGEL